MALDQMLSNSASDPTPSCLTVRLYVFNQIKLKEYLKVWADDKILQTTILQTTILQTTIVSPSKGIHSAKVLIGHLSNLLIFHSLWNKPNYKLVSRKDHFIVHMLLKFGSYISLCQKDTVSQMTSLSIIKVTQSNIACKGRTIQIPPLVSLKWYCISF